VLGQADRQRTITDEKIDVHFLTSVWVLFEKLAIDLYFCYFYYKYNINDIFVALAAVKPTPSAQGQTANHSKPRHGAALCGLSRSAVLRRPVQWPEMSHRPRARELRLQTGLSGVEMPGTSPWRDGLSGD
jgi:hypothetical protein